jgi:hypothetical protein
LLVDHVGRKNGVPSGHVPVRDAFPSRTINGPHDEMRKSETAEKTPGMPAERLS